MWAAGAPGASQRLAPRSSCSLPLVNGLPEWWALGGVSQCGGAVPGGSREVAVGRGLPHLTQPRLWPLDLSCSCQEANSPGSGLGQASLLHGLTLGQ